MLEVPGGPSHSVRKDSNLHLWKRIFWGRSEKLQWRPLDTARRKVVNCWGKLHREWVGDSSTHG